MYPYTHCFAKYIVNTLRGLPPARNGTPLECTAKMNVFVKPKRRYLYQRYFTLKLYAINDC